MCGITVMINSAAVLGHVADECAIDDEGLSRSREVERAAVDRHARCSHRDGQLEVVQALNLVLLGRPALSNPHWPVWAARELGHEDPFSLVPEDWAWWLRNVRAHPTTIGWPVLG